MQLCRFEYFSKIFSGFHILFLIKLWFVLCSGARQDNQRSSSLLREQFLCHFQDPENEVLAHGKV